MKPILFYSMAMCFLLILSVGSAYVLSKFLSIYNSRKIGLKILAINVLAFLGLFGYKFALINYTVSGMIVQLSIIWFVVIAVATILALVMMLGMKLFQHSSKVEVDGNRRNFLRKTVFLPAIGAGLYGGLYESSHIQYREVEVPTTVTKLEEVVMAQVSDVHLGLFFSPTKLAEVLNQCLKRGANMLVLTGDIFDSNILNPEGIKVVSAFAPYFLFGVYFCWGNHEHYRNMKAIREGLAKTPIKVLENSNIKLFSGEKPVYLLGVDYVEGQAETAKKREKYLQEALKGVPENAYKILLAHTPTFIDQAFADNIDFTLSGHTHGGQVAVLGVPILPIFKYMAGPVHKGDKFAYVSRGTGSWFPFRLGCPPEVIFYKFVAKR